MIRYRAFARRRRLVMALMMSIATTSAVATPRSASAFVRPFLAVSTSGERVDNVRLDGAGINSGSYVAISVAPLVYRARKVEFFVNGRHIATEKRWPFDMAGTGPLRKPNLFFIDELPVGTHVVEAKITPILGRRKTIRATFERLPPFPSPAGDFGFDFSAVETELDRLVANGPIFGAPLNGAGLVVVHPDYGIVHETYRGEVTPHRVSLLASTSKVIAAGVLLHLADQGLINMDAPISDYVDWGNGLPAVTAAQLLSNSSGLPGLVPGYLTNLFSFSPFITLEECGRRIARNTADDAQSVSPDTEYRYGGPQWQVAGAVAEAVSGKSWSRLIDEVYAQPCGLDVLGFAQPFPLPQPGMYVTGAPYPGGFDGNVSRLFPTANPLIEGGGYTTPRDYAKILLMHLDGGTCGDTQVLSRDALQRMYADRIGAAYGGSAGSSNVGYGLGWRVDRTTGTVSDPGLFGANAWIDLEDGYGAYYVIEAVQGADLSSLQQAVDDAMNAVRTR